MTKLNHQQVSRWVFPSLTRPSSGPDRSRLPTGQGTPHPSARDPAFSPSGGISLVFLSLPRPRVPPASGSHCP